MLIFIKGSNHESKLTASFYFSEYKRLEKQVTFNEIFKSNR